MNCGLTFREASIKPVLLSGTLYQKPKVTFTYMQYSHNWQLESNEEEEEEEEKEEEEEEAHDDVIP